VQGESVDCYPKPCS